MRSSRWWCRWQRSGRAASQGHVARCGRRPCRFSPFPALSSEPAAIRGRGTRLSSWVIARRCPLAVAIPVSGFSVRASRTQPGARPNLSSRLSGMAMLGVATVGAIHSPDAVARSGGRGLLVTFWVATALLYPKLRDLSSPGSSTASCSICPDYARCCARASAAARGGSRGTSPGCSMTHAPSTAPALSARVVRWREIVDTPGRGGDPDLLLRGAAVVDVPVAEAPHYVIEVAEASGRSPVSARRPCRSRCDRVA